MLRASSCCSDTNGARRCRAHMSRREPDRRKGLATCSTRFMALPLPWLGMVITERPAGRMCFSKQTDSIFLRAVVRQGSTPRGVAPCCASIPPEKAGRAQARCRARGHRPTGAYKRQNGTPSVRAIAHSDGRLCWAAAALLSSGDRPLLRKSIVPICRTYSTWPSWRLTLLRPFRPGISRGNFGEINCAASYARPLSGGTLKVQG